MEMQPDSFPPVQPQDPIQEVLPDLFLVRGSTHISPGIPISRNMVVIREAGELTLIGAVRMPPSGERELEALGKVCRVMRIGVHNLDLAYTVARFGAEFWCLRGADAPVADPRPDVIFDAEGPFPVSDTDVIPFGGLVVAEAMLLWPRHGGVVITSDGLQHYGDWRFFNFPSRLVHRFMGFGAGTIVGPMWHRFLCVDDSASRATFEDLLQRPFQHAVGLHGTFVNGTARKAIEHAVTQEFDHGPAVSNLAARLVRRQMETVISEHGKS